MSEDALMKIEGRIDKEAAGALAINTSAGGLAFSGMAEVMEFAKLMAVAGQAVPKHLRGQPGMCLAVCVQAIGWQMDPFSVANKSYAVNDRIAYEAQLVHAVIEQRAPIKGRIRGEVIGENGNLMWRLTAVSAEDGMAIVYESPRLSEITTKNSPLWKSDPKQQLWYYSTRAMCRRHWPDVLLGVYAKDEIEDSGRMRDVTPTEVSPGTARLRELMSKPDSNTFPERDDPDRPDVEDARLVNEAGNLPEIDEKSDAYKEGGKAFDDFGDGAVMPSEYVKGSSEAVNWTAGKLDAKSETEK